MRMGRIGIALTVAACLLAPEGPRAGADDAVKGDLKALQGKWTAPSGSGDTKVTYTFQGDKLKVVAPTRSYAITVKLDPEAKPEKTIDFVIDDAPQDAKGKTSRGIYKFSGEKFVFSFRPEGDRSTKFEQVGYEQILVELTRAKD